MSPDYGEAVDEVTMNVTNQDFDTMLPYIMNLIVEGFKVIKISDDEFMIKYCGYSIINTKKKEIKAVVKKPA